MKSKSKQIYAWIQKRYEHYDKQENQYCGEKHTRQILKEAEEHFNLSHNIIMELYSEGAMLKSKEYE